MRGTAILGCLEPEELEAVLAASRRRSYRRGQVIFNAGDPGDSLIVVLSGRIKVVIHSADGGELTLTVVRAGSVLGEVSVADGGDRSADAETLEPSELLFIPNQKMREVCARVPEALQALVVAIAASLRRLTEATSDLVFLDLPRRLAKLLLDQPRRPDGTLDLGLNQEELAHHVGGTRQSVNAAMRGFERRGWLQVRDRRLILRDPASLASFAGS